MLRLFTTLCALAALALFTSGLRADDKAKDDKRSQDQGAQDNKPVKAQITDVNPKEGTVKVKMKDKDGKEVERTFMLTGAVRYFDSTGRAAAIDIFRSGDHVLVVEEKGNLREMREDQGEKK